MSNTFTEFSNGLTSAVEKGGASTILVDARKRYPASGIAYAEDLVLTADHVVTRRKISMSCYPMAKNSMQRLQGVTWSDLHPANRRKALTRKDLQRYKSGPTRTGIGPSKQ
jgi:hypothetical protein